MENSKLDEDLNFETLEVTELRGAGDVDNECVVISVMRDCNLKGFLLGAMPKLNRWEFPNRVETAIWLPELDLKKFDDLLIWTKAGLDVDLDNMNRQQLFLGHEESLWAQGRSPLLFEIRRYVAMVAGHDGFPETVFAGGIDHTEAKDATPASSERADDAVLQLV
ncbi:hypothetical protein ACU8V1_23535 [Rhizobium leguminosarum]